jgi:hypothetical protein
MEAGLDGSAIRRLAALDAPTFFQVQEVLPGAMEEMHLAKLEKGEAAIRLAEYEPKKFWPRTLILLNICAILRAYGGKPTTAGSCRT